MQGELFIRRFWEQCSDLRNGVNPSSLFFGGLTGLASAPFRRHPKDIWDRKRNSVALALLVFASEFVIGSFMTEAFGFPLGCMGIALLLLFASGLRSNRHCCWSYVNEHRHGVRPGAIFVLPLLLLWAVYETRDAKGLGRWTLWTACAAAHLAAARSSSRRFMHLVAMPVIPVAIFRPSLYGLSTGTRDWSQAYRDYTEHLNKYLKAMSLQ